jgi:hypothetical protein
MNVPLEVDHAFEIQGRIAAFVNETRESIQMAIIYGYRAQEEQEHDAHE